MKSRSFLYLILVILMILTPSAAVAGRKADGWQALVDGIDYQEFTLPDPNHVYVVRMDRTNSNLTLESSLAQGRLRSAVESVSSMASRYNQAINYWGEAWGGRNKVVAAINGYFFDSNGPWRGQVQSGWYAKRFDDYQNGSGFVWKLDRSAFIGGCVVHKPDKQLIRFLKTGETQPFTGINSPRGGDDLILYTSQYDANTHTDAGGLEILVQLNRPAMILMAPEYISGTVREVRDGLGSTPIPFDSVVLSAAGSARSALASHNLRPGDVIGISQEIKHYDSTCSRPSLDTWSKAYASIGGSFYFLDNGSVPDNFKDPGANVRNPRTAIAFNEQSIYFIVVDGRFPGFSIGMTMKDLGEFARDTLGAKWGINQDGGGSSTLVINGEVKNYPNADLKCYSFQKTYLPLLDHFQGSSRQPIGRASLQASGAAQPALNGGTKCERAVANGMMMVEVEPLQLSNIWSANTKINLNTSSNIRLGPGTNYSILTALPADTAGTILEHPLNGVYATDYYWWLIQFETAKGSFTGWVNESSLAGAGSH